MYRYTVACLAFAFLAACDAVPRPADFTLKVLPGEIDDTIPHQQCVLLVSVDDVLPALQRGTVEIAATAEGATAEVANPRIRPGEVAEVTVSMSMASGPPNLEGWPCSATIRAQRLGAIREVKVPIRLTSTEEDTLGPEAAEMRDLFIPWLAENRPELGIDEETAWAGTIVKPHWLVVSHYLFFSDEWEMHVFWHVMIPPSDWARIELRRRFEETLPSLAYEIASVSAPGPVAVGEIEPEGVLWR